MADPCAGCGRTEIHPFEGLVRSIMDGTMYYVHCQPPCSTFTANARPVSGNLCIGSFLITVLDAADPRAC
jgi:hypothetical protein